ncbi:hypothetical protein [Paracoccus homiensis]|uniref:Argininosuccinate lyase n=1 Tax=Paracoccus homiensis TaxID=364199 RepID=A0A1I0EIY8_9RHOB|nr:hypothetical protein [Paracoccus homiensis]SET44625.1 hypothetical protein SAMN04489858_105154 [Paracoccus homiensis]
MRNIVLIAAAIVVLIVVLTGCGVDGAPRRPAPEPAAQSQGGITLSGDARIGVSTEL